MQNVELSLKELLKQFGDLKKEIEEKQEKIIKLQKEIEEMNKKGYKEVDIVSLGKKGKKSLGNIKVTGFPYIYYENRIMLLEKRIDNLVKGQQELLELIIIIEEAVEKINDSRMRRILTLRYLEGCSWVQVAYRVGGSPDSCRMICDRFLEKS